jgi:ABC-type multidrug transport system ATPase subunit
MSLLATENLAKEYGQRRVVDGVSINVQPGEIVGLLGPNGAGKTTTFNMVVGLVRPDEGGVLFLEDEISHLPMHLRARGHWISHARAFGFSQAHGGGKHPRHSRDVRGGVGGTARAFAEFAR